MKKPPKDVIRFPFAIARSPDQYCERTGILLRQDLVEDLVKEVLDS